MNKDSIITYLYLSVVLLLLFLGTQIMSDGAYWEQHMLGPIFYDFVLLAPILIIPLVLKATLPVRVFIYIILAFISSFILLKTKYSDGFAGMAVMMYQAYIFILMIISFPLLNKLKKSLLENPRKIYKILTTILIIISIIVVYSINKDYQGRKGSNKNIKLLLDIRSSEKDLV